MPNDISVRTIDELKQNFDLASVLEYYFNGKLQEWLQDRYYNDCAQAIATLDERKASFKQDLCDIFGVTYHATDNVEVEDVAELIEKRQILKEFTDDETILEHADEVIFEQQELCQLLKDDCGQTIYLFGKEFTIPTKYKNKKYVGVNEPDIKISVPNKTELESLNIQFENVRLPSDINEYRLEANTQNLTANNSKLKTNYIEKDFPVLMIRLENNFTLRESYCKYDGDFFVYKYENKEIYATYDKYKCIGSRHSLVVVDKESRINIFKDYSVESNEPIFIKGMYLYYIRKKGRSSNGEDLIRYNIKTNESTIMRSSVAKFIICNNKIIYFVWNGCPYDPGCEYNVFENNLDFSNEVFLSKEYHDYNFKIKNNQLHTVGHNVINFFWYEDTIPLKEATINLINIDNIIEYFSHTHNQSNLLRFIYDELSKRRVYPEIDDSHIGIALYKEFIEGSIKIIGADEFEYQELNNIIHKAITPNSILKAIEVGTDWNAVKEYVDWLEKNNIEVDKIAIDLIKRKISEELS